MYTDLLKGMTGGKQNSAVQVRGALEGGRTDRRKLRKIPYTCGDAIGHRPLRAAA